METVCNAWQTYCKYLCTITYNATLHYTVKLLQNPSTGNFQPHRFVYCLLCYILSLSSPPSHSPVLSTCVCLESQKDVRSVFVFRQPFRRHLVLFLTCSRCNGAGITVVSILLSWILVWEWVVKKFRAFYCILSKTILFAVFVIFFVNFL